VAGTNTHTPVASPPKVVTACAGLGQTMELSNITNAETITVREDHIDLIVALLRNQLCCGYATPRSLLQRALTSSPPLTKAITR